MTDKADDYQAVLTAALPTGDAWPRDPSTIMGRVLAAIADGIARADDVAENLVTIEADPRTATLLFQSWVDLTGVAKQAMLQQTRALVMARVTGIGGQSPAYFIAVAAALGFTVTIDRFRPAACGQFQCGTPLYGQGWAFIWRINAPGIAKTYFECGRSACGDPLTSFGNQLLRQVIQPLGPAHMLLLVAQTSTLDVFILDQNTLS